MKKIMVLLCVMAFMFSQGICQETALNEAVKDALKVSKTKTKSVPFFPVRGNHDIQASETNYMLDEMILPLTPNVIKLRTKKSFKRGKKEHRSMDYHVDWKNIRFIAMDMYGEFGHRLGNYNKEGIEWAEGIIKEAMANKKIDHIFVSFHEPAFPRKRHTNDSFNNYKENRDACWKMLVKYSKKVRAAYVGHTHFYYRMRVKDPANGDGEDYPDEEGGVYQIECGSAGVTSNLTAVVTHIDGMNVRFVALSIDNKTGTSKIIDDWKMKGENKSLYKGKAWSFGAIADARKPTLEFSKKNASYKKKYDSKTIWIRNVFKELRDMKAAPKLGKPEFVLAAGDLDAIEEVHSDWKHVFPNKETKK